MQQPLDSDFESHHLPVLPRILSLGHDVLMNVSAGLRLVFGL